MIIVSEEGIATVQDIYQKRVNEFAQYLYDLHEPQITKAVLQSVIFGDLTRIQYVDGDLVIEAIPRSEILQIQS